ncbi:MAG TPA: hypothetical protein VN222_10515 [Novosphingobium sp.]|nr:hypothetical protein [Novosphingobium sp.]
MATRGAKPKPAALRLVTGTHNTTRHGSKKAAEEKVEAAATGFGKLVKPAYLRGEAAKAWKQYIEPAGWLDASREPSAILFCYLWQEWRESGRMFPASKYSQLRAYMSELGLTDERNRGNAEDKEEKDEFFGD